MGVLFPADRLDTLPGVKLNAEDKQLKDFPGKQIRKVLLRPIESQNS